MNALAELPTDLKIDAIEAKLFTLPQRHLPVTHSFIPGFYVRQIFMPAGTLLTSKIHKTMHPYVITKGVVKVWTENEGVVTLRAKHVGITMPNTRRVLLIEEDCLWTTFHSGDWKTVDEVEAEIIEPHINAFTGLETKQIHALLGVNPHAGASEEISK